MLATGFSLRFQRPSPPCRELRRPRAVPTAGLAVHEAPLRKEKKLLKKKYPKDALFLLKWQGASTPTAENSQDLERLRDELKLLEKVSKDAVWFTVQDAEGGKQQVLMVTNNAKHARKYGLQELTEEGAMVHLPGMAEPVTIPVAQLKASLVQEDDSSDSSSEDEDETPKGTRSTAATAAASTAMPDKGQTTGTAENPVDAAGNEAEMKLAEENPHARAQAEALLAGLGAVGGSVGGGPVVIKSGVAAAAAAAAEPGERAMDKEERKKLKEALKADEKAAKKAAKMAKEELKMKEKEEKSERKMREKEEKKKLKMRGSEGDMHEEGDSSGSDSEDEAEMGSKTRCEEKEGGVKLKEVVARIGAEGKQCEEGGKSESSSSGSESGEEVSTVAGKAEGAPVKH